MNPEISKRKWPSADTGPWSLETWYLPVGGRWELVGLRIEPLDLLHPDFEPTALTSTHLRSLVPSRLAAEHRKRERQIREALIVIAERQQPAELAMFGLPTRKGLPPSREEILDFVREGSAGDPDEPRRPGRPTRWNAARLNEVARIYNEAWHAGIDPTKAVADQLHISRSLAAKQVMRCRQLDQLPKTKPGRAVGSQEVSGQ